MLVSKLFVAELVVCIKNDAFVDLIVSKISVSNDVLVCWLSDVAILDKKISASEETEKMLKVFS